ncbi:hypothetical protein [Mycolicibacterium brumae]|uniref:hypothetical protein n=1 Tax=Mycolicibacterium brumae TaxID=85968 RepID=UPI000FE18BEF|nr:hypothetical protein [Mycolicibacterium brumae]MCV7192412.1 hypothetical protein [Mycolicibacterium brumae]UWW10180.1 hypothetical protein L2Z93_003305 [Mycolicibacterium brumae]
MRIKIAPSARQHGITDEEIRAVVTFPIARQAIPARRYHADLFLYAGSVNDHQPHIEVIADHIDQAVAVAFHAMLLRPSTYETHLNGLFTPRYAAQRF